jgi:hypothetical protein
MRRMTVGGLLLLGSGACTADPDTGTSSEPPGRPALAIDVEVVGRMVRVAMVEAARPDACRTDSFPAPGTCARQTDAIDCDVPTPAAWVDSVRVIHDGVVLAESGHPAPWATLLLVEDGVPPGARLVLGYNDGGSVELPLPPSLLPAPEVAVEVTRGGPHSLDVRWTSESALPHAIITTGHEKDRTRCHAVGQPLTLEVDGAVSPSSPLELSLAFFPPPLILESEAGQVTSWSGVRVVTEYADPTP